MKMEPQQFRRNSEVNDYSGLFNLRPSFFLSILVEQQYRSLSCRARVHRPDGFSLHEATEFHASAAVNKLQRFFEKYDNGVLTLAIIASENVTEDMMGKFATFLFEDSVIGYSASSTNLSSVKRQLANMTGRASSVKE